MTTRNMRKGLSIPDNLGTANQSNELSSHTGNNSAGRMEINSQCSQQHRKKGLPSIVAFTVICFTIMVNSVETPQNKIK